MRLTLPWRVFYNPYVVPRNFSKSAMVLIRRRHGLSKLGRANDAQAAAAGLTDVPPRMEIFVTGLVLGTSSLPVHAAITNVGELISRIGGGEGDKKS